MASQSFADRRHELCAADILVDSKLMATNNFLFYGDNLAVLRKSVKDETR